MRVAADIMTRPVVTVRPETPVKEVARLLSERKISGVPVVDAEDRVVGMVTEADLIQRAAGAHLPPHVELLGGIIYLASPHEMTEQLRKSMALTAEQIMSQDVVGVAADAPVSEVAQIMMRRKIKRVPVLDDGRLVGMVTRHDVISDLAAEG